MANTIQLKEKDPLLGDNIISVTGNVDTIADGFGVWIIVKRADNENEKVWPKCKLASGVYNKDLYEGGDAGQLLYKLVSVNDKTNTLFLKAMGPDTGVFTKDFTELASITFIK